MSGVEEKTEALVLLLTGVSDRKLRAVSLEGKLSGMGMEEIASILNHICQKAKSKDLPYLKAYHAIPELLCSPNFTRQALLELRAVARQRDYIEVFRMLLELPPQKLPPLDPDGPEDPFLKDLTLGHRKSLAKSTQIKILRRLFKDQDPAVIRSLLLNPRLTESDILKIASLRPTSARVLEEIFRSPKWIARYRVKKSLVCNPYCPPSIAVHLLKFLLVGDLREIVKFEDLHLAVKEAAHQLLAERCGEVN